MKKAVCILGSPRKDGNTAALAARFADTATSMGADVKTFQLNDLAFKGCQACMSCKTTSETCVVEDDLSTVLAAVAEADVMLMTSPIYFGQVSGQLKCFLDRLFSFLKPDFMTNPNPLRFAPGKKALFITAQGDPDASHYDAAAGYAEFFNTFGVETRVIRAIGAHDPGDAASQPGLMKQAEDAARELLA